MIRRLTPEQASAVYDVLVECAGAKDNSEHRADFLEEVADAWFSGAGSDHLSFDLDNGEWMWFFAICSKPYIDCLPKSRTPERLAAIERTNARLAAVLGEGGG